MEVEGSTSWTAPARFLQRRAPPRWLAEKSGASWSAPLLPSRTLRAPLVEIQYRRCKISKLIWDHHPTTIM